MSPITEQELQERFSDRSIRRGGERYFDVGVGSDYIDACVENDFAIIGIEGFDMVNDALAPRMDLIADFSELTAPTWREFKDHSIRSARAFVNQIHDSSVLLNFAVLSRSEWEQGG
jgi:hypothetical protein